MADEITTPAPLSPEELVAALVTDDTPQTPVEPKPAETPSGDSTDKNEGSEPPETPKEPREGTPDKALQKLQQDMAAAQRKLDKLVDKVESGETLTATEKKEVAAAKRKIDTVRAAMQTGSEFDIVAGGDDLAGGIVEVDDKVQSLEQRLARAEKALAERGQADSWTKVRNDYQGVDVDAVWTKACEDAADAIGTDQPDKTRLLASRYFHERCQAASKSISAKGKPAPKTPAPVSSGRVSSDTGRPSGQQDSGESQYRRAALALVQDDD